MSDSVGQIRARARAVMDAGTKLRASPIEARAAWIEAATRGLLYEAPKASAMLAEPTGLSVPMVDWALRTTLETANRESLQALARDATSDAEEPIELLALVLAGNLFTAAMRAVVVPLLLGVPVLAKASSKEALFPSMLRDALRRADPKLGAALELVSFQGGDRAREGAFIEAAAAIAVYGSDEAVEAIVGRHGRARVIAHGHGVSAAFCGPASLHIDRLAETARAVSLDVCAYDQRGCLSPQVVFVEETPGCSARRFADMLANGGLDELSRALPRGPIPMDVGAAQAQWRGLAEVEGDLWIGADYSVAVVPEQALRWSPGYRNVSVVPVRSLGNAMSALNALGPTLKCVGADAAALPLVRASLERSGELQAYATRLGTMQTPPIDAPADGKPIWHGLLRS